MAPLMNGLAGLNIRKSHPALYRALTIVGVMAIALGINFWISNPTFNPYDIDKDVIGVIFFLIGLCQVAFLNFWHNLKMVRVMTAVSISWMLFWGLSNSIQSIAGLASFQLPIVYVALAAFQIPLLLESPVNPMTEKK